MDGLFPVSADPSSAFKINKDEVFTDSFAVAELFGKRHDNVLKDTRELIAKDPEIAALNFKECEYKRHTTAISRKYPYYTMNRQGFMQLALGYTGPEAAKIKNWFIEQFDKMEALVLELAHGKKLKLQNQRTLRYQRQGRDKQWIDKRLLGIEGDKQLNDDFKKSGFTEGWQYAKGKDILHEGTFGLTTKQHKELKGLGKNDSLRDNCSYIENSFVDIGQHIAHEKIEETEPHSFGETVPILNESGDIAGEALALVQRRMGKPVVSGDSLVSLATKKYPKLLDSA